VAKTVKVSSSSATEDEPVEKVEPKRQRNPWGQGDRLRDEIIDGATAILERTGNEASITLRAVCREIGVTPPSISRFFKDPAEVIDLVVSRELGLMRDSMAAASQANSGDPVAQLFAVVRSVYDLGRAHPNRYRVIFERRFLPLWDEKGLVMTETAPLITESFGLVVSALTDCVAIGASTSIDTFADCVAVWCGLHGLVSLPPTITTFPWPDLDNLLDTMVMRLTRLNPNAIANARKPLSQASGRSASSRNRSQRV
jgi:AcrR family transcriptional regulator